MLGRAMALAALALTIPTIEAHAEVLGEVEASGLSLRRTPNGEAIGSLPRGTTVAVLGREGEWLEVEAGPQRGWVHRSFVGRKALELPRRQQVTAPSGLRVRRGPTSRSAPVDTIPLGEEVTAEEERGNWRKIRWPGGEGWAHARFLADRGPAPAPSAPRAGDAAHDETPTHDHDHGAAGEAPPLPERSRRRRGARGVIAGEEAGSGDDARAIDRRNLSGLNPAFRSKVERILERLQREGWQPVVAEGLRTRAQQREKVRKGYSKTMNSRHLSGDAADIIDKRWGWEGPAEDPDHAFWKALGRAAAAEGLTWGDNWRSFKDVAHVQQ